MPDHHPLPTLQTGAESYFHKGGEIGCLCLHGFSVSPAELRWLGEDLAMRGHTVYIPRLPAHGTHFRDMARMRWRDWYLHALDAYHLLRRQCQQLYVIGHSMGGLLALLLASEVALNGAVIIAAPLSTHHRLMPYSRWLKFISSYTHQPDRTTLPGRLIETQRQHGEAVVGRVRYDQWSTSAVSQLYQLMRLGERCLPRISAPLLLIYSANDQTVPLDNQTRIAAKVSSARVETYTLKQSGHIIPQDVERDDVFQRIGDFITGL